MFGLKKPLPAMSSASATKNAHSRLDRHQQVAGRHQQAAEHHRAARAEQPVGEHAAEERRHVDERGVRAVDRVRRASSFMPRKPLIM